MVESTWNYKQIKEFSLFLVNKSSWEIVWLIILHPWDPSLLPAAVNTHSSNKGNTLAESSCQVDRSVTAWMQRHNRAGNLSPLRDSKVWFQAGEFNFHLFFEVWLKIWTSALSWKRLGFKWDLKHYDKEQKGVNFSWREVSTSAAH